MCGFAGEVKAHGTVDLDAIERMAATMTSRGPDGQGIWTQGRVGLAHRRLSVIDLSESGSQPMKDPELGLVIVFNGCIYNYQELRQELRDRGYHFFSSSDTEVLLKGYHCWGERFVERLQGMFAFCLVERDSGRTCSAGTGWESNRSTWLRPARACALPLPCPPCLPGVELIPALTRWPSTTT